MNNQQEIAVLLFSRSADKEANTKQWTHKPDVDYRIASHLIRRTKRQLSQSTFPVIQIDESRQIGSSFGERLSNAFHHVFDQGYQYVICVGNDCQNLQLNWKEIADNLKSGKTIIGPDQRGGIYLLGISAVAPLARVLERIQWNTAFVFEDLCNRTKKAFILETRRDTNTFKDIRTDKELYSIFIKFSSKTKDAISDAPFIEQLHSPQKLLRAPPFLN